MNSQLRSLFAAVLLCVGLARGAVGASPETPGLGPDADGRTEAPVYVDDTDILYLESYPVQVRFVVRGSLPTPCHEPVWSVDVSDMAIAVMLWSEAPADAVCASVLEPFEVSIPLGDFEAADLRVTLNGEDVGLVMVGQPHEPLVGDQLTGAGWSFGMCAGPCRADLAIAGHELVLHGADPMGDPLFETHGTLTIVGREQLDAALAALDDAVLEARYGCPDCADGGASYLVLDRDGQLSRHDMEYGAPPPELAQLDALAMGFIDALRTCRATELVDVAAGCTAWRE